MAIGAYQIIETLICYTISEYSKQGLYLRNGMIRDCAIGRKRHMRGESEC